MVFAEDVGATSRLSVSSAGALSQESVLDGEDQAATSALNLFVVGDFNHESALDDADDGSIPELGVFGANVSVSSMLASFEASKVYCAM